MRTPGKRTSGAWTGGCAIHPDGGDETDRTAGNSYTATPHANNPTDMLHRLETMMLMGIDLPLQAIQRQVASALDIIIHLGRLRDKTRKVLQIVEVEGYEDGRIQTKVLYEFKEEGMKNGKIQGCLMKKNEITNKEKLLAAGYHTI